MFLFMLMSWTLKEWPYQPKNVLQNSATKADQSRQKMTIVKKRREKYAGGRRGQQ